MTGKIHAEFPPAQMLRKMALVPPGPKQIPESLCNMNCTGAFRWIPEGHDAATGQLMNADGTAYLDVIFKEGLIEPRGFFTDLTGEGKAIELSVSFPASYINWFTEMHAEIVAKGYVLGFIGSLMPEEFVVDHGGKVSDCRFDLVSLVVSPQRIVSTS